MERFKTIGFALLLTAVAALTLSAGAEAQSGPWVHFASDGRVTTFDFTCHGDAYNYEHIIIYTSAGRRVLSFTQSCTSNVGVVSKLTNVDSAGVPIFPTLLDTDGLIERIDVIGFHRYGSTLKHIWPYSKSTSGDTLDETMHAGNLPEQYNDTLEPLSSVSMYIYASPPVP